MWTVLPPISGDAGATGGIGQHYYLRCSDDRGQNIALDSFRHAALTASLRNNSFIRLQSQDPDGITPHYYLRP